MTDEERYDALLRVSRAALDSAQAKADILAASLERIQAIAYAHECPNVYCTDKNHLAIAQILVDTANTLHAVGR